MSPAGVGWCLPSPARSGRLQFPRGYGLPVGRVDHGDVFLTAETFASALALPMKRSVQGSPDEQQARYETHRKMRIHKFRFLSKQTALRVSISRAIFFEHSIQIRSHRLIIEAQRQPR